MTDDQGGKKQLTYSPAGKIVLIGAGATVLALINMSGAARRRRRPSVFSNTLPSPAGWLPSVAG